MMFRFNFGGTTSHADNASVDVGQPVAALAVAREHFVADQKADVQSEEIKEIRLSETTSLRHVQAPASVLQGMQSSGAVPADSDLVPGVYEGGLKVWEGGRDLAAHLAGLDLQQWAHKRVLEVGCGAGLPGIVCLAKGCNNVAFQDYNAAVIDAVTIPNCLLNVAPGAARFFSGDWASLTSLMKEEQLRYDVILTAETIYNVDNQVKLMDLFDACLAEDGQILLAAKTYYFGVGGDLRQFEAAMAKTGRWTFETVSKFHEGVKREIVRFTRTKADVQLL